MKVWQVTHQDPGEGTILEWLPTKREAQERHAELTDDGRAAQVHCINIPTTKARLLSWLNSHFNRDNG